LAKSSTFWNFAWTAGTVGASSVVRFGLNVVLAHILVPEILGVMVVVNSVRLGIELLSDVGIEQNIIHHPDSLEPRFRDTAWTVQVLRGLLLSAVFLIGAPVFGAAYGIPTSIFLVAALGPILNSLHSTAIFALVKKLEVRRRSLFELLIEVLYVVLTIGMAWIWRSVWAPVLGVVLYAALRSALSYTLPDARQHLRLDREVAMRIIHFGKWIAVTSLVMYAASNVDRLYLGTVVPLGLLGIYGIARTIAEVPTTLARRISYQVVFPSLAGARNRGELDGRAHVARTRLAFVLATCGGIAAAATCGDLLIALVYDARYQQAGWMLTVLLLGAVFATLSNLNEALLLAGGRPAYSTYANLLRLATLATGVVGGYALAGMEGVVVAVALAEVCQYAYIAGGQLRIGQGFWKQDAAAVLLAAGLFVALVALRHALGWGTPFDAMGAAG
jgi:O-antigen/teichoic acid export membrane protein